MGWSHQGPGIFACLLISTAFLADARECKINCRGSPGNLLKFEPGKVYNYKLDGESVTSVAGATGEASKLGISADVQVAAISGCEHVLKVTNVQTSGQDSKKHNLDRLSQQPIKFGLQNGHIESELCVNDAEDSVGLNIKRAVLSLIQSSVLKDSGYGTQSETDVFGTCPTGFEFSKAGGTITIVKNRDLNKCAHREDITSAFLTVPYQVQSDIQTTPLLQSSLRSEQKIEGGSLKSAYLEEHYNYRPSGSVETTAKVVVKTRLTLSNSAPGAIPAACTVPRSIIFEQEHLQEGIGVSNKIVELIKQGCEDRIISEDTGRTFSHLVRAVAAASKADINAALQHVKSGPGIKDRTSAQRMLLDAIVAARSGSSVEVMADILKRKEVDGTLAKMWLLGLGFVKHASKNSLSAVLPLLDGEPDINAYLGIGSLAGKFCRNHQCDGVNEVNQLQIKLGAPLLKGCRARTKHEEDQIIASLKGLGNIKYLGPKIAGKIVECAQDENARPRIRSAALDTIASDPHKTEFKTLALNLLKNTAEDSEIRIKAFQVLAKCPCGKVANAVKDLLDNEGSNQVGGYVVSFLRNLHSSTNPDKAAAKHYLGNIVPPRRFIIDPKRYSVNQELSYMNGYVNSGASGEVDLIYSQNSFLPRSVSLNLTSQLFGTAWNLLELDVRAENLERVAERLFGPRGYLQSNSVDDIVEDGRNEFSSILERIAARYDSALRPKRSVSRDQLDTIAKKVHLPVSSDDVDLDLSMKVLGSEVGWTHIHGSEVARIRPESVVDQYFTSLEKVISSLKNSDVDYRRHMTILDRETTYPTGMGLALRLRALGTAAIRVKVDGKIDIPAIIKDPRNTDVKLQLIPSAAINLGGEIMIDGVACETGVRMDLDIHTSTGSDVTFRLLDGRGVDVKIGIPLAKQELISVKTQYNSIIREDNQALTVTPVQYDTPRETYSGCFDQLNTIAGLTFCGEVSIPYEQGKPVLPFHGPINLGVSIDKEDESLTAYHFKAFYDHKDDNSHGVEILLDTPNSRTNRKLSLNLAGSLQDPNKFVSASVISPWASLALDAHVVNTDQEHSLNAKLNYDGQEYAARLGAKASKSGDKTKYEPIFEYKAPEGAKNALIGKKGGPKAKSQSISTSGALIVERTPKHERYVFQGLAINTPRTSYVIDGTINLDPESINADLKVSYDKEHVTIRGKGHGTEPKISGHLEVIPSQYPDLGLSISVDSVFDKPNGKFDEKLIIVHGPDPNSQVSRIFIHNHYEISIIKIGETELNGFSVLHEITYPVVQLDASVKASMTQNEVSAGIRGKFDKYSAKLEGALNHGGKMNGEYQAAIEAELMGQELKFQASRALEGNDRSRFVNQLILKPGGTYQLNALVSHKLTDNAIDLGIEAQGSIPNNPAIKLSGALKQSGEACSSKLQLYLGDKCFIDGSGSLTRKPHPNGNFKLALPGYLESEGKLSSNGVNSNFIGTLNLPKSDRKMEAKADVTVKDPKYVGEFSLCYDTKDPKKTIKLSTNNEIINTESQSSIDTKNTLSLQDTVLKANGRGKLLGSITKGTLDGAVEVILPNGYQVGGSLNRKADLEGKNKEIDAKLELWDHAQGAEPQKLVIRNVAKRIDLDAQTIDGQASISYVSRDKKDLNGHLNIKKLPSSSGKSSIINIELGTTGSLIDLPLGLKLESDISNQYLDEDESISLELDELPPLNFKASGHLGDDIKLDATGKVGKPSTLEVSGSFPESTGVKTFKLSSSTLMEVDLDDDKCDGKVKLINSLHWNGNRHINTLVEAQCDDKGGLRYAAEYDTDSISKRRISGSAHLSDDGNLKGDASVALSYDGKSADLSVKGEVNKERTDSSLHILANAPIENGKVDILIKNKITKEGRGINSDIIVNRGSQKITVNGKVDLDRNHPVVDVNVDHPEGKSRFFYQYETKGPNHYVSELKAKWTAEGGGSLAADTEVNLQSVDNFLFKGTVDAPSLIEPSKVYIEVSNKPAKGEAKKITIVYKEDDKVVASGHTNYNFKEEGDVAVFEGSGTIKYKDQDYPLNFQATRQLLENGRVAKLTAKAGKASLNIENKMTPEEFSFERTYCREPKQCSKTQISSKLRSSVESDEQTVIVLLDLSLLNPKLHDIAYKSVYKRNNLLLDHNIELKWAKDSKLKSHAYIRDTSAGVYVTLPKRTIGGEVKYDARKKDNSASFRVEADLYLNKDKDPKLCLIAGTTTLYDKGTATMAGEVKVTHPSLGKDLFAKGQIAISDKPAKLVDGILEIDVSPNNNNKIIGKLKISGSKENMNTIASLKSKGCNIDITYEEKIKAVLSGKDSNFHYSESLTIVDSKNNKREYIAKVEGSAKRAYALMRLSSDILVEGEYKLEKGYSGSLNLFGRKYQDSLSYNRDSNILNYRLTGLADGQSLNMEAGGKIGGTGVLRVSLGDKRACSLDVNLDEANFLKSKYSYDTDNLKAIYNTLSKEVNLVAKEASKSAEQIYDRNVDEVKRLLNCLDKGKPNLGALVDRIEEQLKQIREEIANDRTVKEAVQLLREVSGTLGHQISVLAEEIVKLCKAVCQLANDTKEGLVSIAKKIEPKLKASLQRISKLLNDLLEQYLKISEQLVDLALKELKKHDEDIKALTKTILDLLEDVGKQIGQLVITINTQIEELVHQNVESLKELPIVATIQERWQEMKDVQVPEEIVNLIHEVLDGLKQLLPTQEATQFVSTLESVLEKVLRHEDIKDRDQVLKQLYDELVAAVKSLIALLAQSAPQSGLLKPTKVQSVPLLQYLRIPSGSLSVSLVNFFLSKEYLPSVNEILTGLRISLNPLENIPPYKGVGFIIGGTEIVTFDGLHLAIPAPCSYILAEDYKDRNFSIVAQLATGGLKSLTVITGKDSVELRPNVNALLNGKETALPASAGDLRAWRRPATQGVWSKSGVLVLCSASLDNCMVEVNGFYFGRLRGLLGNLNGEQYDERLLPEGKIVQQTGDLANAWKLDSSCSVPSTGGHKHNRVIECTSIFADDPSALLCRAFVNPAPYRDACDHLAARSKDEGACLAVRSYIGACRGRGVLIAEVPEMCAQCTIQGKTVDAGESVNVQQGKSADIVLAVSQATDNEQNYKQIAQPLVGAIKSELAKAGVSDVRTILIGATPSFPYPSFFTDKSGEIAYDPSSNNLWWDERPVNSNETVFDQLKTAYRILRYETGQVSSKRMYRDIFETPLVFRPNSYRLVLGVHGMQCAPSLGSLVTLFENLVDLELHGAQYSLITPSLEVKESGKKLDKACVLDTNEVLLSGGEKVSRASYDGLDMCVVSAVESGGTAIGAKDLIASPQRAQLIQSAASKIVSSLVAEKRILECECALAHGILPHPECNVL